MADPPDIERLIQDVLAELGWGANPAEVAKRVRLLDIGLPREDEFAVVCAWLGKCILMHKLDQAQVPSSSRVEFQVPDLLALFSTQTAKVPLLIEVKSSQSQTLSFTPAYVERITNYANLTGFPLLIGWKFHGIWMLFEMQHMKKAVKNFNITFETAMKENLLGFLAGDVAYKIGHGAGLHLRFRKDKLISKEKSEEVETEQWAATLDQVLFSDYEGNMHTSIDVRIQSLLTSWDLEDEQETSDEYIWERFLAGEEGMLFAHMALVRLLGWPLPEGSDPHWRRLLHQEKTTANLDNFREALRLALEKKFVRLIIDPRPHTVPNFLA